MSLYLAGSKLRVLRMPHIYCEILAVFGSTDVMSTSLRLYVACLIQIFCRKVISVYRVFTVLINKICDAAN